MNILYWLPVVYSIGLIIIFNVQLHSPFAVFIQGIVLFFWTIGVLVAMRWNRWKGIPVLQPLLIVTFSIIAWWVSYLSADTVNARFWTMTFSALYSVVVVGWYAAIVFIPARSGRTGHYHHWMLTCSMGMIVGWAVVFWSANEVFFFYSFGQVLLVTFLIDWGILQSAFWAIASSRSRELAPLSAMGAMLVAALLWLPIGMAARIFISLVLIITMMSKQEGNELRA